MCILFHTIIQCLHIVITLKKMFFLYQLYVVPKSLTWRNGEWKSTSNAILQVVMSHKCANEKEIEVLQEQRALQTLGFSDFRHTGPTVSSHSKTQDKIN